MFCQVSMNKVTFEIMNDTKSDRKSEELRAEGNGKYSEKKFFEALLKYNESLCNATSESANLGFAFANRSAVYLEMKLYEKSLKNIELAKAHNYPIKSLDVLEKREEKCRALMKQQIKLPNPWSFFKLSYKANKKLPFVVNSLELRVNEKYGKHIVTNSNLKVGDILVIEKPFCSVLLSESRFVEVDKTNKFQRCAYCLKDNQLDLIPCSCCEGKLRLGIHLRHSSKIFHSSFQQCSAPLNASKWL